MKRTDPDKRCAFMDKPCNNQCVAHVSSIEEGGPCTFPCVRLDALYDISTALNKIQREGISATLSIESLEPLCLEGDLNIKVVN